MWLRGVLGLVSLICWGVGSLVIGLAQEPHFSAAIQHGDCEDLGEVMAPRTPPVIAAGEPRGNPAALPAASSFTTVPSSFDAFRLEEHASGLSPASPDQVLTCADIGGPLTAAGALIIGLPAEQPAGTSSVAFLRPTGNPAQTAISLFVTAASLDARTGRLGTAVSQEPVWAGHAIGGAVPG